MAYPPLPRVASAEPGGSAAEAAVRALLEDLASRKELRAFRDGPPPGGRAGGPAAEAARGFAAEPPPLAIPGLRLHGGQLFLRNLVSPDTDYPRVLVNWQTGKGKSIGAIAICLEFVRQFRSRAALGEAVPSIFVLGFTIRDTILDDMLRHPEFGFASAAEVEELRRLRAAAAASGAASPEAKQLAGLLGTLRRRVTDPARGGLFQFFGYKEFASRLLAVTRLGLAAGFDAQALYGRGEGDFGARLAAAVRRGEVEVNEGLLAQLRGGLVVCDEIHNVYNIREPNNYGIALQYVFDALGDEAPRGVLMSATPATGSAAEFVDLLNLLVPRAALPGGLPLRRADFFARTMEPAAAGAPAAAEEGASGEGAPEEGAEAEAEGTEEGAAAPEAGSGRAAGRPFVVSQLREGALERIAHLAAGRVSFLLDADTGSYPRRIFVGEEVAGVPYLLLTPCPMSPFHERTLDRELLSGAAAAPGDAAGAQGAREPDAGLSAGAYTLYDMAYPNPDFAPDAAASGDPAAFGLYRSSETLTRLARAPESWRAQAGITIGEPSGPAEGRPGLRVVSGPFLAPDRLPLYSAKLARLVQEVLAAVRAGPGKIMVYHHRVRMSGVLQILEALRMNGFADETSAPTDATLCGVCGVPRRSHAAGGVPAPGPAPGPAGDGAGPGVPSPAAAAIHHYTPARAVVAHSETDRSVMRRSLERFNAPANLGGHLVRVLVAGRIVKEGYNFTGVRHQLIASLPTDYPTMIQVFGRVVRKGSHAGLPPGERDVRIRILVSTRRGGGAAPELRRYADKGREYLVIQEVERALRRYAVDGFANYERVLAALPAGGRPGLDGLPYAPAVGPDPARPVRAATFAAYGHDAREVFAAVAICRAFFRVRPVWTYADLWGAVRAHGGGVAGANHDPAAFDEGTFAQALAALARPGGDPPFAVVRAGAFFVAARAGPGGTPLLDVESYLRDPPGAAPGEGPPPGSRAPALVSVRAADYVRATLAGRNFAVHLRAFEDAFLRPGAPRPLETALTSFGAAFHYALLRRLVAADSAVTSDDARVRDLYRRFRAAVTLADASAPAAARSFRGAATGRAADDLVGFVTPEAVSLYDDTVAPGRWYSAPLSDFGIGRRSRENGIVVGFVASPHEHAHALAGAGETPAATGAPGADTGGAAARFKIRPPLQALRAAAGASGRGGARALARGAVCSTRPRAELEAYARRLREAVVRAGLTPAAPAAPAPVAPPAPGPAEGSAAMAAAAAAAATTTTAARGGDETALAENGLPPADSGGPLRSSLAASLAFGAQLDRARLGRHPSAAELCSAIQLYLLALEEAARAPPDGLTNGVRWLYTPMERPPSVSALLLGPRGLRGGPAAASEP